MPYEPFLLGVGVVFFNILNRFFVYHVGMCVLSLVVVIVL